MIALPSTTMAAVQETAQTLGDWAGLGGVYGPMLYAVQQIVERLAAPPPPLTASTATLLNRLRYPGGRKFRRAIKRLGLRVARVAPLRTGPACQFCGLPTVPREAGGPSLCAATFPWTRIELTSRGWRQGTLLWCEPIADAPSSVQEIGGTSYVP